MLSENKPPRKRRNVFFSRDSREPCTQSGKSPTKTGSAHVAPSGENRTEGRTKMAFTRIRQMFCRESGKTVSDVFAWTSPWWEVSQSVAMEFGGGARLFSEQVGDSELINSRWHCSNGDCKFSTFFLKEEGPQIVCVSCCFEWVHIWKFFEVCCVKQTTPS